PSPVIFGSATKISGQLQSQGNAGRTVELQATPFPYKGFVKVATTTTDALGRYSFTQSPTVNTHYQVVAKGPTVTSRTLKLGVRIRLTRKASDTTPAIGQKVRFTGFACPAHIGDVVSLQRRRNGHWETVKQTHLVKAAS